MKKFNINLNNVDWDDTGPKIISDRYASVRSSAKRQSSNSKWKKAQQEGARKFASDPENLKRLCEQNKEQAKNPKWVSANKAGAERRKNDPEWQAKKAEWNKKQFQPVITPFGEFEKCGDVKKFLDKSDYLEKHKSMPHLYYKKSDGPGEVTYEKVWYTPYGMSNSVKYHYDKARDFGCPHALKINQHNNWMTKMLKKDPENYYTKEEPKREWLLENN